MKFNGLNPKHWSLEIVELNLPRQNFLPWFTSPKGKIVVLPPLITHNAHQPSFSLCSDLSFFPIIPPFWHGLSFLYVWYTLSSVSPLWTINSMRVSICSSGKGSQLQHCWHFRLANSLLWEAILCIIEHTDNNIPDLYRLDVTSIPTPLVTAKNISRHWRMFPRYQHHFCLRTTDTE